MRVSSEVEVLALSMVDDPCVTDCPEVAGESPALPRPPLTPESLNNYSGPDNLLVL